LCLRLTWEDKVGRGISEVVKVRVLRSLAPVLAALAGAGVLAADPPLRPRSEQDLLMAAFGQYLRCERALAAGTAGAYVARASRFLEGLGGTLDGLAAGDVAAAVLAEAEKVSVGSAQYFVAALRAGVGPQRTGGCRSEAAQHLRR
jgi:hypothetical protein